MTKSLRHYGVLGMKWGKRRANGGSTVSVNKGVRGAVREVGGLVKDAVKDDLDKLFPSRVRGRNPETKAILDKANSILNNPKATQKELDEAHASIGINPKTGRIMKTAPVYDKDGNDVSVNPLYRLGKPKGQSDKDFDAEVEAEMNPKPEKMVGKPVKTLFGTRTKAVYDSSGNDISSKPFSRPFKKKGQSDKDYDAEIDAEDKDIASKKIFEANVDRNFRVQTAIALGLGTAVTVGMYLGQKSLKRAADAQLVAKYGPVLAEMIKKGAFGS